MRAIKSKIERYFLDIRILWCLSTDTFILKKTGFWEAPEPTFLTFLSLPNTPWSFLEDYYLYSEAKLAKISLDTDLKASVLLVF